MTSRRSVPALAQLSIALASCAIPTAATPTSQAEATTTTTIAATTSSAGPSTTSTLATTTTAAPATTLGLPLFPPELAEAEHGDYAWVVVLAGSHDFEDPAFDIAVGDAEAAGYDFSGPTDCDEGAPEALGMSDDDSGNVYTVSVYLRNEEDAHAALAAFQARGVDGVVALVQLFCLD